MGYKPDKICVMLDCSRNAVMKPDKIKEFILIVKKLGYNAVMLYLEDTFEISGEPFFGYLRGRYSKQELKDIDAFAVQNQIELIPCVQTLAHLNAIFRWQEYSKINDLADVLLVDNPRTHQLIERIFDTVCECFTCKTVNVGLDEAHLLGRGKFLDFNGYEDRFEIFSRHVEKVCNIAQNRGLTPIMWSDTFFERSESAIPYACLKVPQNALKRVPKQAKLICWDYYHTDKNYYDNLLKAHDQFDNEIWYACSAYTSRSFAPNNAYSMRAIEPAMKSCRDNNIKNVIVTMWGGNGAECSQFAVLPSLYFASQTLNGNFDKKDIADKFKAITGEDFDAMKALDSPNNVGGENENYGTAKYMFYNDLFSGIYDCTINPEDAVKFKEYKALLESYQQNSAFGYLFETQIKLCEVLEIKYALGYRIRTAYKNKDDNEFSVLVKDIETLICKVEDFYQAFRTQWFIENKPQGFDVQDIRIGGLIMRLRSCMQRIADYLKGEITVIEELEEKLIDLTTGLEIFSQKAVVLNDWQKNVTVNIL